MKSGLVSITFRKLTVPQVIDLVSRAGLQGIEWGGDIHVPHGQIEIAKDVAKQTTDAGLVSAAYGSYYRVGEEQADAFARVLDTAVALNTTIIRVWMGNVGSATADEATRARVAADARRISELAAKAGIPVAAEWHGNTLTDSAASAQKLFDDVNHSNFRTYWQPHQRMPVEQCLIDMDTALPRLAGLHVFQWDLHTVAKQELSEGEAIWPRYLAKVKANRPGADQMFALIEFVKNDDPDQFLRDAATLNRWLNDVRRSTGVSPVPR